VNFTTLHCHVLEKRVLFSKATPALPALTEPQSVEPMNEQDRRDHMMNFSMMSGGGNRKQKEMHIRPSMLNLCSSE